LFVGFTQQFRHTKRQAFTHHYDLATGKNLATDDYIKRAIGGAIEFYDLILSEFGQLSDSQSGAAQFDDKVNGNLVKEGDV
jgi:hypothetical protein